MPKFTLDVPQEVLDLLRTFPEQEAIPELALAALREWARWFAGTSRPATIAELEIGRIFDIYHSVLKEVSPSVDSLGQQFNMPMGRARYIVQSLEYRHRPFMRTRQIQAISLALEKCTLSDDKKTRIAVFDRGAQPLIDQILNELEADAQITSRPTSVVTTQGVRYDLGDGHHKALTKKFGELLNGSKA